MEEIEAPVEHLHETVHHEAHHATESWITAVALSTALLAALAAVAALLSGYHANKAVMDHISANDTWSYYQAKNVKTTILQVKVEMLEALDKPVKAEDRAKIKEEKEKMAKLQAKGAAYEEDSDVHFERHEHLARSVTLFQVAIAICAIAVLTKRQWFWMIGLAFGVVATAFLIFAIAVTPKPEKEEADNGPETGKEKKESKQPKGEKPKSESGADMRTPHDVWRNIAEDAFHASLSRCG
jgi:hypothetical protein